MAWSRKGPQQGDQQGEPHKCDAADERAEPSEHPPNQEAKECLLHRSTYKFKTRHNNSVLSEGIIWVTLRGGRRQLGSQDTWGPPG